MSPTPPDFWRDYRWNCGRLHDGKGLNRPKPRYQCVSGASSGPEGFGATCRGPASLRRCSACSRLSSRMTPNPRIAPTIAVGLGVCRRDCLLLFGSMSSVPWVCGSATWLRREGESINSRQLPLVEAPTYGRPAFGGGRKVGVEQVVSRPCSVLDSSVPEQVSSTDIPAPPAIQKTSGFRAACLFFPLVIPAGEVRTQHVVDAPVAKAPAHLGDLDDPIGQLARGGIQLGRVTVAVAGEPHKATRAALGQVVFVDHLGDRLALGLWG